MAAAALAAVGFTTSAAAQGSEDSVELRSREFTPPRGFNEEGIRQSAGRDEAHFLLQFDSVPSERRRASVERGGVELVSALGGTAYIASVARKDIDRISETPGARWAGVLRVEDKLDPAILDGRIPRHAKARDGKVALTVQLHPDVPFARAREIARANGGRVIDSVPLTRMVTAVFESKAARRLAAEDGVQYVSVKDAPLDDHNSGARAATGSDVLNTAPYSLSGAGSRVMVYDSGVADAAHPDFAGRIAQTDADAASNTRSHSTHVAGTVLGSGANSNGNDSAGNPNGGTANQHAGMAPGATLATFASVGSNTSTDVLYDDQGDLTTDAATAIAGGIDMATMSQGNNTGPNGLPCSQLGDYTNTAIALDALVRGGTGNQELIFFQSAGNERNQACTTANRYATISSPAPAKDTIVVGAVNSNDNSMTGFSSWGPTDDGRLRPDLVGPGCQAGGDGGITSTDHSDADGDGNLEAGDISGRYSVKCGTSMATPAVAGTAALVLQQWRSLHGGTSRPLPHTMKALLAHTATDLGTAGPDYANGFGHVNGQAAVDLVTEDFATAGDNIVVDEVGQGQTDTRAFFSDGAQAPRATLAWSDPPATRTSTTQLLNDLDLRLKAPDGTTVQPLVLDPAQPANAAAEGDDTLNVIELVAPASAQAGVWRVTVNGQSVPSGPQRYTLITSNPVGTETATSMDYQGQSLVNAGEPLALKAVLSSALAGCKGGRTVRFSLDDDPTTAAAGDGPFPLGEDTTDGNGLAERSVATTGWRGGNYTVRATFEGAQTTSGASLIVCTGSSDTGPLAVNAPPVANDDAYGHFGWDTALNVPAPGVLANDTDADGDPLTASLVSNPSNGSLTLNANGSFTYLPNDGFIGTDTFTYKADDGKAKSTPATVRITVGHGCDGRQATRVGTGADDNMAGTAGDDVFVGLGGDDDMTGGGGNDALCGNAGEDDQSGGAGADYLHGGADDDRMASGAGNDRLRGAGGADRMAGDDDDDALDGGDGSPDTCSGGRGTDTATAACERTAGIP